jgi:hypothetical protein
MKPLLELISAFALSILLSGCLASSTSPDAINCNPTTENGPVWEWPLACQPNG